MDDYQQRYYEENRERVALARKAKYHGDHEYREALLKRARDARKARQEQKPKLPGKEFSIGGAVKRLYTIGDLAKRVGIPHGRGLYLLKAGHIPQTPYVSDRVRYFSDEQISGIASALKVGKVKMELADEISRQWAAVGVPTVATIKPV